MDNAKIVEQAISDGIIKLDGKFTLTDIILLMNQARIDQTHLEKAWQLYKDGVLIGSFDQQREAKQEADKRKGGCIDWQHTSKEGYEVCRQNQLPTLGK